jgi:DNA polymerase elongation subunit (family B)
MNNKKELLEKIEKLHKELKELQAKPKHKAKILVFDIETSLMKSYHFGMWQQDIATDAIIDDWFVLGWSAKWLLEDEIMSDIVTPTEALQNDDRRVLLSLHKLLNEADIVVAHNGKKFDIKKISARFFVQGIKLPSPYKVIDTLQQVKSAMSLTSNRLDYICKIKFGEGKLSHTGLKLWIDCKEGKEEALKLMDEYCQKDVKLLEDFYLELRPYMTSHPNLGMYVEEDLSVCPTCASEDLNWDGEYHTTNLSYNRFQCNDCGSWGASSTRNPKKNQITNKKAKNN